MASKNSRKVNEPATRSLTPVGHVGILIPLAEGKRAYVFNFTNGKTLNLEVGSEAWNSTLAEIAQAGHARQLSEELTKLHTRFPNHSWDKALSDLQGNQVL